MIGETLGGYVVEKRLGFGAGGEVYLGHEVKTGRAVAIKSLVGDWTENPESLNRFLFEARAAAKLRHSHIVAVHTFDMTAQPPYMVMDYIAGPTLEALLEKHGCFSWPEALDICAQVAEALACAHDRGIIHCDVKPGNIMVENNGKRHVRVTDFGLARILTSASGITFEPRAIGSPAYMSPEQCRGEDATPASDLFSLGIVTFELIAGRLPFEAATASVVARKINREPMPRLRSVVPDAPEIVQRFLEGLTAKSPRRRYQTACAVVKDARAIRAGRRPKHLPQDHPPAACPPAREKPAEKQDKEDLVTEMLDLHSGPPAPAKRPGLFDRDYFPVLLAFAALIATVSIAALIVMFLADM
ncbi:MAG: serine/threonine-protein kinase [Candidatus Hydrogenedentota bacterium]